MIKVHLYHYPITILKCNIIYLKYKYIEKQFTKRTHLRIEYRKNYIPRRWKGSDQVEGCFCEAVAENRNARFGELNKTGEFLYNRETEKCLFGCCRHGHRRNACFHISAPHRQTGLQHHSHLHWTNNAGGTRQVLQ